MARCKRRQYPANFGRDTIVAHNKSHTIHHGTHIRHRAHRQGLHRRPPDKTRRGNHFPTNPGLQRLDQRFPPLFEDDVHFNGDGSVTAIRIANGHADFKQRYVQTDRYKAETAARRSLFGRYRNPFTDNESVKGVIRTASNTNITFWRGMLLATKEDGPPWAMDPVTLETLGRYDFDGQIKAPTFTAHPKFDPETGEMICYAYEAGGNGNDGSLDIIMWTIDANGKKVEEAYYKAPFAGMIHDIGVSQNFVVMPLTPLKVNVDRMARGGERFACKCVR